MNQRIIFLLGLSFCLIMGACGISDSSAIPVTVSMVSSETEEPATISQIVTASLSESTDLFETFELLPRDTVVLSDSSDTDEELENETSYVVPEETTGLEPLQTSEVDREPENTVPITSVEAVETDAPLITTEAYKPSTESESQEQPQETTAVTDPPCMESSIPDDTVSSETVDDIAKETHTQDTGPVIVETDSSISSEPWKPPVETEASTSEDEMTFTEFDHARILSEVMAYAEGYRAQGFVFEWKETMTFGWDVGYMGTPRVAFEGVNGVIETLKYHVDLIYRTSTDVQYGIVTTYMTYKIEQIIVDGDLAYVVLYGG